MSDTKISALPAVTDVLATDEFVLARSGTTNKIDAVDLAAGLGFGIVLIQEITVAAGGAATVDFTSIPGTYRHLRVEFRARAESAGAVDGFFRFNNDSGANYNVEVMRGTGASAGAAQVNGSTTGYYCTVVGTAQDGATHGTIEIPYYATGTSDHSLFCTYMCRHTSSETGVFSTSWTGTAAITQITFALNGGGDYKQDSIFSLYGIS